MQNESAPDDDYVSSNVSPYQADRRGSPILEESHRPPLPPKPRGLLYNDGELPSQSGEISVFADPRSEPPPSLRPRYLNVHNRSFDSSTHTMNGSNVEDIYDGISY